MKPGRRQIELAKERGVDAARKGLRRLCPYEDKRTYRGGVTFSRGLRKAWFEGYDTTALELKDANHNRDG